MAEEQIGSEFPGMKKIKLITLTGTALVGLGQMAWAGPRGGGSGFGGGGHFGGGHFSGYVGGGFRAAPAFSGSGARFNGRSIGALTPAPQRFSYYNGARTSGLNQHAFIRQLANRSTTPHANSRPIVSRQQNRIGSPARQNTRVPNSQVAATNRQPNRTGAMAGRNRVSDPRTSTAANRQSFVKNHASERHDANNWHRDWDKHRSHFHQGHVFVFIDGFWWGLSPAYFPWDYYPYYAYGDYPYDYSDNPYNYYDYSPSDYDDQPVSGDSDQYGSNATVSAVQSELAKLGYYHGVIDGVEGDETQAALARYQEDRDLSVTGTVTAATLQSLGLPRTAS